MARSRSIRVSPRAQRDLDEIWEFSARHWGSVKTEAYIRHLWQHLASIAEQPGLGQDCGELRPGYRKSHIGAHLVFYRQGGDCIEIMRILHERMDCSSHL